MSESNYTVMPSNAMQWNSVRFSHNIFYIFYSSHIQKINDGIYCNFLPLNRNQIFATNQDSKHFSLHFSSKNTKCRYRIRSEREKDWENVQFSFINFIIILNLTPKILPFLAEYTINDNNDCTHCKQQSSDMIETNKWMNG